jgi:hypothetical protein
VKRSLWCLLAFLCCGVEGWATPTFVQKNSCNGSTTCTLTNVTAGDFIGIFYCGNLSGTIPTWTPSDDAGGGGGNTYGTIYAGIGSGSRGCAAFYVCSSIGSAGTVTFTMTLATGQVYSYQDLGIYEASGTASTSCLDNKASDTTGTGSSGNFSATSGGLVLGGGFPASTAGTGFTSRIAPDGFFVVEDQILSGSTANASYNGGTDSSTVVIGAVIRASGGGSTPTCKRKRLGVGC